jgi:hypothetical protein
MKKSIISVFIFISFGLQAESWDSTNDPKNFRDINFSALWLLPQEGKIKINPWSGDYWPTYKGGISYRWADNSVREDSERYFYDLEDISVYESTVKLSPAEKWDLYKGDSNWTLTKAERKRTKIFEEEDIAKWQGLCHAWAPAALLYHNPKPVTLIGANGHKIKFGSSDIKALMIYHLHLNDRSAKTKYLGSRCQLDFSKLKTELEEGILSQGEYEEKINSVKCGQDVNAGSFHIALANEIGRKKTGFIIDKTRDAQVWNHPVYSYKSKIIEKTRNISPESSIDTRKEVTVETKVTYITEVGQTWNKTWNKKSYVTVKYKYILELGRFDRIIGGRWISFNRPDFIWKQTLPSQEGRLPGINKLINMSR